MSSEALKAFDAELAAIEQEHHDTTMRLGHEYVMAGGAIKARAFQRYCESHEHRIDLHTAESTLQFYANTLIGESHE